MVISDLAVQVEGVWLPKHEKHLLDWMTTSKGAFRKDGKITYQWAKQQAAMDLAAQYITDLKTRAFVDVGAHVGLWSMWWGTVTPHIIAFEPIQVMRAIYQENMRGKEYTLHASALAAEPGKIAFNFNPENTGNTHRLRDGAIAVQMIEVIANTMDAIYPENAARPGVIKVDCEGSEAGVILGAETLIRAHKPLIIVEQKKGADYYGASPTEAVEILGGWGYRTLKIMSGDYMMAHGDLL